MEQISHDDRLILQLIERLTRVKTKLDTMLVTLEKSNERTLWQAPYKPFAIRILYTGPDEGPFSLERRLYELESKGIMEAGPGVYHGQGATSKGRI